MKRIMFYVLALLLITVAVASAAAVATVAAPVVAAVPTVVAASPSFMDWIMGNKTAIFGVCLAISEFMSLIPAFKGNGILDTIIKALELLSNKPATPPAA